MSLRRPTFLHVALVSLLFQAAPALLRAQVSDTSVTYLQVSRLFDSEGARLVGPRVIRVRGRMIDAVEERLEIPAGARVIDLRAYTVLPGLIDAHVHLLYLEDPAAGSLTSEGTKAVLTEGTPLRALRGGARARTFLDAGITTVRDLGNSGRFGDVALKIAIAEGSVEGPRMFVSGPGLSPVGGQFPGLVPEMQHVAAEEYRIVRNPDDAAEAVREHVTFGADVIKIYSNNTPNRGSLSPEELRAIVAAARRLGVPVSAHATSDAAVWRAAEAGVQSIEHAYGVADSTLALMARNGVAIVPTDVDSVSIRVIANLQARGAPPPTAAEITTYLQPLRDRLQRAVRAGVTVVAGSDNYINMRLPQGTAARHNLFAYGEAGMSSAQVLQAATWNAARLLGPRARVGAIVPGRFADIIAVSGDPLANLRALEQVAFVMKDGRVYRAADGRAR